MIRSSVSVLFLGGGVALAAVASTGCASLSPPFDKMKDQPMTVYRLQNYEVAAMPASAAATTTPGTLQLPPQIQQWIAAGASLLPPGLLPPGLLPGTAPAAAPAADVPRFHDFRILDYQVITDPGESHDIVDVFGHGSNFQASTSSCMYAEFGFAMAQRQRRPRPTSSSRCRASRSRRSTSTGPTRKLASRPTHPRRSPPSLNESFRGADASGALRP